MEKLIHLLYECDNKKLQLVAQCLEEKRINLAKSILLNNRQDITNDTLKKEITKHFDIFS